MVSEPVDPLVGQRSSSSSTTPSASRHLMTASYIVGGVGLAVSFWYQGRGDRAMAATWAAAVAVGGTGLLSFVRHSLFHRSDAVRMGWDYGRRNDFQIEVGFANLAWGLVGLATCVFAWGAQAQGGVVLVFGVYMLSAAVLHLSELRRSPEEGGGRVGPVIGSAAFAVALLAAGFSAMGGS
jgi:hypothetical protein